MARTPIGRLGTPEEVAATVAFLASDDAAFFVGATSARTAGSSRPSNQSAGLGALDQLPDVPGDLRPQLAWEVMAHPLELDQLGSGDGPSGGSPAAARARADRPPRGAPASERRPTEAPPSCRRRRRSRRAGGRRPPDRGRGRRRVPSASARRLRRARIRVSRSRARSTPSARSPPHGSWPAATGAPSARAARPGRRSVARGRHHRGQGANATWVVDRHRLGDHRRPSTRRRGARCPGRVRPAARPCRRPCWTACTTADEVSPSRAAARPAPARRSSDSTRPMSRLSRRMTWSATLGDRLAEAVGPAEHLRPQTHDQQHWRQVTVTEPLVRDVEPIRADPAGGLDAHRRLPNTQYLSRFSNRYVPSGRRYRAAASATDGLRRSRDWIRDDPRASQRRLERRVVGHLDRRRKVARQEHVEPRRANRILDRIVCRKVLRTYAARAERGEESEELVARGRAPFADGNPPVRADRRARPRSGPAPGPARTAPR